MVWLTPVGVGNGFVDATTTSGDDQGYVRDTHDDDNFDYEILDYKVNDLVKVEIMINGDPVDALSLIVHRDKSQQRGRALCERLKDLIPRQQFKVAIQAAIGGKIIARETVSSFRKDVTQKLYGGERIL